MFDSTVQFLSTLLRCDPNTAVDTEMLWRVIPREGGKALLLRGSLRSLHNALESRNEAGAGVFIQVNAASGTKDKDVTGVRALFVDNDVGPLPTPRGPWPVAPSMLVHSGHGDHAYWLVDGRVKDFKAQQSALAAAMATDPSICNPSRVMRVPGFWWTKPDSRDAWKRVGVTVGSWEAMDAAGVVQALTTPGYCGSEAWARWRLWCGCNKIRGAKPGESQNTFNRVAFAVKDFCRAGYLPEAEARRELAEAGADRGVDGVAATLNSAFNAPGAAKVNTMALDVAAGGDGPFFSANEEDLARDLIARWGGPSAVASVGGIIHIYDNNLGVWSPLYEDALRAKITLDTHSKPVSKADGTLSRIITTIGLRTRTAQAIVENAAIHVASPDAWRSGVLPGLAFSDGFLRSDGSFVPHGAENRALWRYEWAWGDKGVLDEAPPAWASYFAEVWSDCGPTERALRAAFLGAWFGSALLGFVTRWGKAIIMWGPGNNGKSVLLTALERLVPPENVACVPIDTWKDPYYRVGLAPPATLNLVSELPEDDWLGAHVFKGVVTGDRIVARSPSEKPISFRPVAGHMFALNTLPGSSDRTEGFWRRIAVLPFEVDFKGREEAFSEVVARLVDQGEDFLRWAIGWALTSVEMGALPTFTGSEDMVEEWAFENDPVAVWLSERTERLPEGTPFVEWASAGSLFGDFNVWAGAMGYRGKTIVWWGKAMKRLGVVKRKVKKGFNYPVKLVG